MFGIGIPELIVILGLALIVVGPDKLPELARSIAKGILELKKTAEGVKEGLTKDGGMFEDLRPELDAVKTLQKELAETTDIDWSKDYSVEKSDTIKEQTDTPNGNSSKPETTALKTGPDPVSEEKGSKTDADPKTTPDQNHPS
jgi:sec-independent protein translocase protein TatB